MRLHTSVSYLDKVMASDSVVLDFYNLGEQQNKLQLADLLFHGVDEVYLEDDDQTIEQSKNILVKRYLKDLKIKRKTENAQARKPLYDLYFNASLSDAEVKSLQKKKGCFHGNHNSDPAPLFGEYVQHFDTSEKMSWEFASPMFEPHNSVVIIDPYLFTRFALNGLIEMFRKILPRRLQEHYHITLIGRRSNLNDGILLQIDIEGFIQQLKMELSAHALHVTVEYFFCNQHEFHDRYIFTNNTAVFLGSGVSILAGNTPFKEGSWLAYRPYKRINFDGRQGVFFYKVMQRKLRTICSWLNQSGYRNFQNPLLQ